MQQQSNFTLLDLVFNEQQNIDNNNQKTTIKETAKFIQYNQLGLSLFLDANSKCDYIEKSVFSEILKLIEDKLSELEERLDNREKIQNISSQLEFYKPDNYFKSKHIDDTQSEYIKNRKMSQQSNDEVISNNNLQIQDQKSQRSKSQIGRTHTDYSNQSKPKFSEERVIQKLEQFDKKISQINEQISKQSNKDDLFQKKIEQQIYPQLKECQERLISNEKMFKQFQSSNNDISDNQRGFLQHITQMRQEIDYIQQDVIRIKEENKLPLMQLEENQAELTKIIQQHTEDLDLYKNVLEQIDQDIFAILKKFKDVLTELANKKIKNNIQNQTYQKMK